MFSTFILVYVYLCVFLVTLTSFWLLLQMLARWVTPWLGWWATILYDDLRVIREEVLLGHLAVVLALQGRAIARLLERLRQSELVPMWQWLA